MANPIRLGLTGKDSISQTLRIILSITKREVPFRPNLGLNLGDLIDTNKTDLQISAEITEQIEQYEPRIKIKKCSVTKDAQGLTTITILYKIVKNKQVETFSLSLS